MYTGKQLVRKAARTAAALLAALCLSGAAAGEGRPVTLMIVSDIHYLSPALYEQNRGVFENALKKGDGKMAQYSRELLDGLVLEVRHRQPDALIVSGDLSFNGERASHLELAAAFEKIRAEGTDVWVIPGNHDVSCPYAGGYIENRFEHVPNAGPEEFAEIYAASMVRDGGGKSHMSYTVPLGGNLLLAMCDVCVYDPAPASGGSYTDEIAAWLRGVLAEAAAAGARVVTVTHQSLVPHTEFMLSAMTVAGGDRMARDMRESGAARLNLSGHLHVQHISSDDGIYDIATGAFSVPPFRYGLLTLREDGSAEYEAFALCREHLPEETARRAETWFEETVTEKERPALEALAIPEADRERMLDYAAALNHAYFMGEDVSADSAWARDPALAMWTEIRDRDSFAAYLTGLTAAPGGPSSLRLSLPGAD